MVRLLKCEICGQEKIRLSKEGICDMCLEKIADDQDIGKLSVNLPHDLVCFWRGSATKLGWALDKDGEKKERRKLFEVPKPQRPFIEFNTDYLIIIKKVKLNG